MFPLLIRFAVTLLTLTLPAVVVQAQIVGYSPSPNCATCLRPQPVYPCAFPRPAAFRYRYRTQPIAAYYPAAHCVTRYAPCATPHYVTSQAMPRHLLTSTPYRGFVAPSRSVGLHGRGGRLVVAPTSLPRIASTGTGRPPVAGSYQPSTASPPLPNPDPRFAGIPHGNNRLTPTASRSPQRFVKAPSAAAVWQTRRFPIRR